LEGFWRAFGALFIGPFQFGAKGRGWPRPTGYQICSWAKENKKFMAIVTLDEDVGKLFSLNK
jgi:hypothetical protein